MSHGIEIAKSLLRMSKTVQKHLKAVVQFIWAGLSCLASFVFFIFLKNQKYDWEDLNHPVESSKHGVTLILLEFCVTPE